MSSGKAPPYVLSLEKKRLYLKMNNIMFVVKHISAIYNQISLHFFDVDFLKEMFDAQFE